MAEILTDNWHLYLSPIQTLLFQFKDTKNTG